MPDSPDNIITDLANLRAAASAVIRKIHSGWDELQALLRAIEKHHATIVDQVTPQPTPPKKEKAEPKQPRTSGSISAFPVADAKS